MEDYLKLLDEAYREIKKSEVKTRFKIPIIKSRVIKNKTIVENFFEIVTTLRREEGFLIKFFSKELGAPISLNGTKMIINKIVKEEVLQEKLKKFVEEMVLCKVCRNPDTKIENNTMICEACGATNVLV
ncbi:MAG: hypothetical protein RMJ17_02995 [Candidatus Aenigmarchaeota archaeon]|nr:hypothetical protein [Candidatus Aenigmarchaeota archaeon]MDW8149534.1 hypothetical protein [Candidatus Aenigmarchaeota archaeon]